MGGGIPKQFRSLCGRPVLWWSMKAFHNENKDTRLIIVLPEEFISLWKDFYSTLPEPERFPHDIVSGGKSRSESVYNGLKLIEEDDSYVAVHDGARPLISESLISQGWESVQKSGAAVPVVPVTDSLRIFEDGQSKAIDRSRFVAVQTPQVFYTKILIESYEQVEDLNFSDDATVAEHAGYKVELFEGNAENIKITNPKDLAIAAVIMGKDA